MPRNVQDFGRRQRVQLELRVPRLHRAEQILVPRDRQVRVVAALQQQLIAADGDRLVDLAEDLLEAEHVAVGRADRTVERAEVAARDADVRVVDVAVDDVGDDRAPDACGRGCVSARRPSRCVGAWRYSSSASAALTRPPCRHLVGDLLQHVLRRSSTARRHVVPSERTPAATLARRGLQVRRVVEKHLQSGDFVRAEAVLHIIP